MTERTTMEIGQQASGMLLNELGEGQRFCLLVFPAGNLGGKRMNFFSNASGPELAAALREVIEKIDALPSAIDPSETMQ